MTTLLRVAAASSSALLRLAGIGFLRWIPGHHFPPIIFTSLAVYLASLWFLLQPTTNAALSRRSEEKGNTKEKNGDAGSSVLDTSRAKIESEDCADSSFLKTLLTGLPSKNAKISTLTTVAINVLLALFTADFLFRALIFYPTDDLAFSRVGYVSPTTAKLLVREPDPAKLPLIVSYREAGEDETGKWIEEGKIYSLGNSTDFTYPVTLKNLKPSTQYRYSLSNNLTGSFVTAPLPGSQAANRLTFLTSSCIKPNFPYSPFSHPLRIRGLELVSRAVSKLPSLMRPSFMLFLGDFIYIDVPLRFGSSQSHYRSEYRRVYSSPSWYEPKEQPTINLPWIHTLDDHEIANDWSKGNTTAPYPAAAEPYSLYHVSVNPPIPPLPFATPENTTYFSFIHGPASFFMLDTRTYRSAPLQPNSTMLGSAQLQSLLAFLARPEPAEVKWKIVASSVPFTKNWHIGTQDTWGGFLNERRTIFEAMWRAERDLGVRIVLLSGDRHEFATTRFPDPELQLSANELAPGTAGEGIHEFSVGPLNMFYLPIRTYRQTDDKDVMVKYAPDGNVKFGQIDIDVVSNSNHENNHDKTSSSSVLTYSLYVDGVIVWKYQLSVPLHHGGDIDAAPTPTRLPPGQVLLDETGWQRLRERIGSFAQKATRAWDDLKEKFWPVLEKIRLDRL
ncbi:Alkaline phosphatase family protein [Rasamsonia emersonii CBS 393.64]|uniref:Alkaline phosphatase family protein n=1 Tax=Rasamsonia emersonii (strain ATCC 16479 / CBS 393.64 / IMI 116815) TaxID=1408163 RepID=A0A0F4YUN3_RASE3|nr:Alkaline phosphatase family protein [Rasamsonia emersonii CBS 393.64]KKA21805.1 Alkaline phosphatase family protein [Rasamsonia emersonii CBS 393.64]